MNSLKKTCVITLHGIGFEQPPQPDIDNSGYADLLHEHLKGFLGNQLSDDPKRKRNKPGQNGAIYVQSRWENTAGEKSYEEGLRRLGTWSQAKTQIDLTNAPLATDNEPICHIALVYSNLEPQASEVEVSLHTLRMVLGSASHYASVLGAIHMALADGWAILKHSHREPKATSSLPRNDLHGHTPSGSPTHSTGLGDLIKTLHFLEDDVACYVCYNETRERVRSFVSEALTRLAMREDVENIILNTHSNGCVIAFDVLRHLDPHVMCKMKALITAGCPLRKYVDLFHWGAQIQCLMAAEPWYNFWDRHDPVGDPMGQPLSWRVGDTQLETPESLFNRLDLFSETLCPMKVTDVEVNNVEKSQGGGLQAHNYWDNEEQFVQPLAALLTTIAQGQSMTLTECLDVSEEIAPSLAHQHS